MKKTTVAIRHSAEMAALHQVSKLPVKTIQGMFPQYSLATIYRHAKKTIGADSPIKKSKLNRGRPRKLTERQVRDVLRTVKKLRNSEGSFASPRVEVLAGLSGTVSNRTIRRTLNRAGYKYLTTRKKGVLSELDYEKRMKFCKKVLKRKLGKHFWTHNISFYLDGTGFEFKVNPFDQARAPGAREWRTSSEGLQVTAKGKKEGVTKSNFMVAISYGHGVVLCAPYTGAITGEKMAKIARKNFPKAFRKSVAPKTKRVLMDGCPRQNSKTAHKAYDKLGAKIFKIPARSPDLNPIENFFHLVKKDLKAQAIRNRITRESMEEFNTRVVDTLKSYPVSTIDRIIESMDKRIELIIKSKGRRIKY